jgi:hypothetical protein
MTGQVPDKVKAMVFDGHIRSAAEQARTIEALRAGAEHGYGNMIAWLATAWAVELRDASGLPEKTAIAAASGHGPYPLPQ